MLEQTKNAADVIAREVLDFFSALKSIVLFRGKLVEFIMYMRVKQIFSVQLPVYPA